MKLTRSGDGSEIILSHSESPVPVAPQHFDPAWWHGAGAEIGSASGRGKVRFVRAGEEVWALRHYLRGGWAARISADSYLWLGLQQSRPWHEWRLTDLLYRQGLPVPKPVGARVRRQGIFYRGDILTRRIERAAPLGGILREGPMPRADWVTMGTTIRRFHQAGVRHDDISVGNILRDDGRRFFLIDFDKARLAPAGKWQEANLARLHRSLAKCRRLIAGFRFAEADWDAFMEGYGSVSPLPQGPISPAVLDEDVRDAVGVLDAH